MSPVFRLPDDPHRADADVRGEIELHLELRAREFEEQGMTPEAARRAALAAFGDRASIETECRELRGGTIRRRLRRDLFGDLGQDVRLAIRGLLRAPGFALAALLTLAIAIGANAGIFGVVRSVLLRPLPYPEPDRLVQLWTDHRSLGRRDPEWFAPPELEEWRRSNRTFAAIAGYRGWAPDLTGGGAEPEALAGVAVSWNMPALLGAIPPLGRGFVAADDDAGAEPVILVSDALWRRRFGADPALVNRTIQLNGEPWTVIGVLPRGFEAPFAGDVWRPFRRPAGSGCQWGCVTVRAIGRMKPGVSLAQAREDLSRVAAGIAERQPRTNAGVGAWLIPLHEQVVGPTRPALIALTAAVALVLLIGCVNLANLLLVRGSVRARELSVRAALGAGRGRLLRQLLTESAVLAVAGGALGFLLALWSTRLLGALVPAQVRSVQAIGIDGVVIAFTAGLTAAAGILFGLLPAARSARADLMSALRSAGRDSAGRTGGLRRGLVVAQLAFAVVLLVGAGLLLRSFLWMQRVDLGYRHAGLVTVGLAFPRARYDPVDRASLAFEDVLTRLRANPEVRAAEVVDLPPLSAGDQDIGVSALGEQAVAGAPSGVWYRSVSPGYLRLMGMRIVQGRDFTPEDRAGSARVGIVNEEAARRFWPGKSPVGRELASGTGPDALRMTIVGVVANARHDGPGQPYKTELFMPFSQFPSRGATIVLEPARQASAAVDAMRASLREVDPLVPTAVRTMEEITTAALALPRTYALLVGVFAAIALALAALGVYGVMAYAVTQRRHELGVRLALGAGPASIRQLVLREGAGLASIGLALGMIGAVAGSGLLRKLLFGVSDRDPVTLVAAPAVLAVLALLASWIPARRAARVDPLVAIREE